MSSKAIFVNGEIQRVGLLEWAAWFETADRTIARTDVGEVTVSTVFLAIDYGFGDGPLWFETVVLGGPLDSDMDRYETLEQAMLGHERMVARVKAAT
jgi:hypothetical protein